MLHDLLPHPPYVVPDERGPDVTVFSAIEPGTDLSEHARDLVRVHVAVLGGGRPPMPPRGVVARSWSRVMRTELDPGGADRQALLPPSEPERRRRESPLALIVDELREVLSSAACASSFLLVVTDAQGVILWRQGAPHLLLKADGLGFTEAAVWTEEHVGTNAIGTALAEGAPVQLFSAEHYEPGQHLWYCTASPVHDPRTGEVLGIVDVSGPALSLHPVITAHPGPRVRRRCGPHPRAREQRSDRRCRRPRLPRRRVGARSRVAPGSRTVRNSAALARGRDMASLPGADLQQGGA